MAKQKIRSDMILRQIAKRHTNKTRNQLEDVFFTEVKNGRSFGTGLLRLDALAIKKSWANPCITGYEVKVDRGDFLRDDKWPGYLKYCHQFYFACPLGMIQPDELPVEVGLIYYNPEKDCISTKRKAVYRPIEIPRDMLMYLLMSRHESDRHSFFSSGREYFEALAEDKADRKELGIRISKAIGERIDELQDKVRDLERKAENSKEDSEQLKNIKQVLIKHGIGTYKWNLAQELDKALAGTMPQDLRRGLEAISYETNRLMAKIGQ